MLGDTRNEAHMLFDCRYPNGSACAGFEKKLGMYKRMSKNTPNEGQYVEQYLMRAENAFVVVLEARIPEPQDDEK